MNKFHVNEQGNVGRCTASAGSCRFGSDADHSNSRDEARSKAEKILTEKYSELETFTAAKKPLDRLVGFLFAKPLPMERQMKAPMPDEFKIPRNPDPFSEFVGKVEDASTESLPEREMSQAAWNVNRDRIFNREIPVVDENFKSFYNDSRIENSNLTLQGWEPENATQDYIVKDLVSNVLAQHSLRLEIDGIKEDPFVKAFDSKNTVETVGKPNNSNQRLQTVSDFSSGVISGLIDATERAKNRSFPSVETEAGNKKQLREFLEDEGFLYEIAHQEDKSDFNDGRAWFISEYHSEGF